MFNLKQIILYNTSLDMYNMWHDRNISVKVCGLQQFQFLTGLKVLYAFPQSAHLNNPWSKIKHRRVFTLCSYRPPFQTPALRRLCSLEWILWTAVLHTLLEQENTLAFPFCISLTQSGHYWDFDLLSEAATTSQWTLHPRSIQSMSGYTRELQIIKKFNQI